MKPAEIPLVSIALAALIAGVFSPAPAAAEPADHAWLEAEDDHTERDLADAREIRHDGSTVSNGVLYAGGSYGAALARDVRSGVGLTVGYRQEVDHVGVSLSFNSHNSNIASEVGATSEGGIAAFNIDAIYLTSPLSSSSTYAGGGLAWQLMTLDRGDYVDDGHGLAARLVVGRDFRRGERFRIALSAEAYLPTFRLRPAAGSDTPGGNVANVADRFDNYWSPMLSANITVGWD